MAKPQKKYSLLSRKDIEYIKKILNISSIKDIDTSLMKKLKEELKKIKDVRNKNMITYKMWDVIMCVIIASFADCNTWEEIHEFVVDNYKWLKSFLQMTGGIPKEDSYERIMGLVDFEQLNSILVDFLNAITFQTEIEEEIQNYDGRINNGSKRKQTIMNEEVKPLNCLNVYSTKRKMCIATIPIDSKTNEIPTIEEYIKNQNLKHVIVTADALNTQKSNVAAIINSHGDYVLPIKGNQTDIHNNLEDYFNQDKCDEIIAGNLQSEYESYYEKSHGQLIHYENFQTSDVKWYDKNGEWKNLNSIGMVKKTITKKVQEDKKKNEKKKYKEVEIIEKRYYISSLQVNIKLFSKVTRSHWNIENKIHWHLDYTFRQDNNTTTNKNALLNLEIIHKFVIAVLERVKRKYNMSLVRLRKHLSRNINEFFPELMCNLIVS